MASAGRGLFAATFFVGASALVLLHGCAGDRLVLPTFDDAGSSTTSDASCTQMQCGSECIDPMTDPRHCGTCTNACAGGSTCTAGKCSLVCPTPFVNCGGACIDPKTNADHCGAILACDGANAGAKCTGGMVCKNGACAAPSPCPANTPDTCTAGGASLCTDFKTDPAHCGDCTTACGAGKVCNNGACGVACNALQTTCGTGAAATCHTPTAPNDCCGTLCAADKDCTAAGCVACIPVASTVAIDPPAPDPALKVTCLQSPCPVVKCGGITYFIFSYFDNRSSFGIVGYNQTGGIAKPLMEKVGARYIDNIVVNNALQTVTLNGQNAPPVILPFTDFRLP